MLKSNSKIYFAVLVASLGYFVDIFDLVLFSVVRVQSLKDLGVAEDQLLQVGVTLLNSQMFGMLLGGIFFGVLGDKIGRVQALFGSILLYSIANIANAFVTNVEMYSLMRFLSGFGLAGEVGGAITLVSEILSKEKRGLGTSIVAASGAFGAVIATYISGYCSWQTMYIIGGVLGLMLLLLRVSITESGVFSQVKSDKTIIRGSLKMLFSSWNRFIKLSACLLIGLQFMFMWTILTSFSPEIAKQLGIENVLSATPIALFAIGVTIGDIGSCVFSQLIKSRKKTMYIFLVLSSVSWLGLVHLNFGSKDIFNWWFLPMGFFGGIWAVLVTASSEQYGTNLRATATSMIPNFIRGATVALTSLFSLTKNSFDIVAAVHTVGGLCLFFGIIGVFAIKETFGISLDFIESDQK